MKVKTRRAEPEHLNVLTADSDSCPVLNQQHLFTLKSLPELFLYVEVAELKS